MFARLTLLNKFLAYCLTHLPERLRTANEVFQNSKVNVCVAEAGFIFLNVGFLHIGSLPWLIYLFCQKIILTILRSNSSMQTLSLFLLEWKNLDSWTITPKADLNISALSWSEVFNMRKEKAQPLSWQSAAQHHNYVGLLKTVFLFLSEGMKCSSCKSVYFPWILIFVEAVQQTNGYCGFAQAWLNN